jgi:alkylhydroperoxidase family enzyme
VVEAVYRDPGSAPVCQEVRAALRLVKTVTMTPTWLSHEDFQAARQAGLADEAIDDVVLICVLFNIIDRLADAFGFFQPDEQGYREAAKMLLKQGYDLPPPLRWSSSVD